MKRFILLLALSVSGALSLGTGPPALAAGPAPPFTQCPAIGADTSCAVLVVQNPDGSRVTLVDPSQPPFDNIEDTLIGFQNNSSSPVSSLPLTGSGSPIPPFSFDGDGICSGNYGSWNGSAGCPYDATGYGGPGVSFSNISADQQSGTVNFSPAIPAGGSAYWSLEGPTASIAPPVEQQITANGINVSGTEGQQLCATIANWNDPTPGSSATEYTATIDWGDGSGLQPGTINGNFTVAGCHTYTEEGKYTVTTTVTDTDTPSNTSTATSTATVADAALAAKAACPANSAQAFSGPTATFTDAASPSGTLSDFSATINWGDGSTTAGTVSGPNGGPYTVSGSHTYSSTGNFTITTSIKDVGGASTSTSCSTLIFAFAPGGGSFAIGDLNSKVATNVTFWGAQWAKDNQLSGGGAPNSFKGFAESPKTPACGSGWTTDPGNSTPPPPGPLPAYMAVIVTSQASQSGSTISGNTVHLVVVKTNPGYQPNPGHPGTGTVVAQIC